VLVFANTKAGVEWLAEKLKGNGFPAEGITGDLPQRKRFKLMEQFKNDQVKILVATDVASRGIHVEDISHVFNYDLPQDSESYVHRIGRTARAGKTGQSISLACENYVFHLEPLEEMLGYKLPVVWPEDDWFAEDKAGPVKRSRRPKPRHATRKPSQPRNGKPSGRTSGRTPRKPAANRLLDKIKDRPAGYFPGSFFGFLPPKGSVDTPEGEEKPITTEPAKKKRRRWRRKKKSSAHKSSGHTPTTPGNKPSADAPPSGPRETKEPPATE
jgi:ATP-dependent RNA helicase RhlB